MKRNYIALCVAIIIGLTSFSGCGQKSYLQEQKAADMDATAESSEENMTSSEAEMWVVQVAGAVKNPGVYKVPAGSRVYEAIEQAGGLQKDACQRQLNQARVLTDGEVIYVNTEEEAATQATVSDGRVNINTATVQELCNLPGIGETRAQTIIAYRESNGLFSVPEDLMKVSGIGESTYKKLENAIKVN